MTNEPCAEVVNGYCIKHWPLNEGNYDLGNWGWGIAAAEESRPNGPYAITVIIESGGKLDENEKTQMLEAGRKILFERIASSTFKHGEKYCYSWLPEDVEPLLIDCAKRRVQ